MKIGILREGKTPPDKRVPLTPEQCIEVQQKFPHVKVVVQPSAVRSFKDEEYVKQGIIVREDLKDCDVLLGVKEVRLEDFLEGKIYLFFSHTIKKQAYNRKLLQTVLQKNIPFGRLRSNNQQGRSQNYWFWQICRSGWSF